jgi:hypothetical protein
MMDILDEDQYEEEEGRDVEMVRTVFVTGPDPMIGSS